MFPSRTRVGRLAVLMLGLLMLYPAAVAAQGTGGGSVAGVVRDDSGAVLPGVTIEASSPALIEGTRTAITDSQGRYQVVNLRPGTYTVTFTLPGFRTLRREGIEVTTGFTATVDGTMAVGALEETVTVSGEAPLVDVRSTTQSQVLQGEVVRELPLGKNSGSLAAVLASAILPASNTDVGGSNGEIRTLNFTQHGVGDLMNLRDGMVDSFMFGGSNNFLSSINPTIIQESEVQSAGGLSAEAFAGGMVINTVPREGSNRLTASFLTDYTHANLQSDNLSSELRARGATSGSEVKRLHDIAGGVGGPIVRDRLWYFAASRFWISETFVPGVFYNRLQGRPANGLPGVFYEPDTSRRGFVGSFATEGSVRLTWQATPRNKIVYTPGLERNCNCQFGIQNGNIAPEAINDDVYWPYHRHSGSWQSPVNNRLLLQVGALFVGGDFNRRPTGAAYEDQQVLDRQRNFSYGNTGFGLGFTQNYAHMDWSQYNINGSASYVTGSHALKIGGLWLNAPRDIYADVPHDQFYTFAGSTPGVAVPEAVTQFATPFNFSVGLEQTALYVQDQWTIDRLTLNLGLRYDHLNAFAPAISLPAGPFVGAREFPEVKNIPNWNDLNLRTGAAVDLRGNGRTALKVNLGRFVAYENNNGVVAANAPANLMVTSATRVWNDANRDYIPQPSELGPPDNSNFGKVVPGAQWDPDLLRGWHVRPYNWQGSVSLQHQLLERMSINVGYFRTWFGNFRVTDNLAVGPNDFDQFCVTVPGNVNLSIAGEQVCGLYDVKPQFFGLRNDFITDAENYGGISQAYNGVDVTLNARLAGGGNILGGFSTGRTVLDFCDLRAQLPETTISALSAPSNAAATNSFCRNEPAWTAKTGFKLGLIMPLPWDLQVSANYQNNPGVPTNPTYSVGTAEVTPSLQRPLASRGRTTVTVLEPDALFREGRIQLLSFALTRNFRAGGIRFQPRLEVHNALNAGTITVLNGTVGPAFDQVRGVVGPRMVKFAFRFDF